uniref:Uncharacterized protein n=1 Tax=Rhinopithecus bieti TaxID=61621 RepID=A0A2K6M331_RHIBE
MFNLNIYYDSNSIRKYVFHNSHILYYIHVLTYMQWENLINSYL